ncbi:MAG: thiamine phosphate synthase [Pirellulales bacterium]|nr:thiamine phosphate synthase [Pirellulales bacterium]
MLPRSITPAVERALQAASCWTRSHSAGEIGSPELLLGLLSESECRAALWLDERAIDSAAVLQRWPDLVQVPPRLGVTPDTTAVRGVFRAAILWLGQQATDEAWATEHLLLGIVASEDETALWLADAGFAADELARRIGSRYHDAELEPALSQPLMLDSPAPESGNTALRIIDAAANRAREGLRVVEDYARFGLDDRFLTGELKRLRHDLAAALEAWGPRDLLANRETRQDVGTTVSTPGELLRSDVAAVLVSNFKRIEEALRSLEEYGKLTAPAAAAACESLRYRAYTLEKALLTTHDARQRLAAARLYVLTDGAASAESFADRVALLVAVGVGCVQLRAKDLDDRELLARAQILRELTRDADTLAIVNDRADISRLARADGVHLGQEDLSVKDARNVVGPRCMIGVSTHSIEQARAAVLDGADYIGVGPTFASTTKSFAAFTGLELLVAVAAELGLPAFAIGGIDAANLDQVLQTGIVRVAVSGAIWNAADPRAAAAALTARLAAAADQPTSPSSSTRP